MSHKLPGSASRSCATITPAGTGPATIHLVEGPVGAGKSTYAAQLSLIHAAPRLNLDEWIVTLFVPDRPSADVMPWYLERKHRCIDQIWNLTCDLIDTGTHAILELGLIQRQNREDFYHRVDAAGYPLRVYVLEADENLRRQRVQERNKAKSATFRMHVPEEMFKLASSLWQAPDEIECNQRDIQFITT